MYRFLNFDVSHNINAAGIFFALVIIYSYKMLNLISALLLKACHSFQCRLRGVKNKNYGESFEITNLD